MPDHPTVPKAADLAPLAGRGLFAVAALSAVGSSGYGTLTPALAELADVYGVPIVAVALLQGVVAVPGIALALVIGRLADLLGRGRVVLACLVLFAIAGTACVFVDSFEVALGLRALQGLGFAGLLTIPPAIIGSRTQGKARRRGVAINSMVLTIASTVGPVVGGVLASTSDPRNLFWIYAVGVLLIPSTIRVIGLSPGGGTHGEGGARHLVTDLRDRGTLTPVIGALFLTLGTITLVSAVTSAMLPLLLLEEYGADVTVRGLFIGLTNIGSVAASASLAIFAGRVGDRVGALLGLALMTLALMAFAVAPSLAVVAAIVLVFGFGVGTTYNSAVHQISRQDVAGRGLLMGSWSSAGRAGQFLGPVAGAGLTTSIGAVPAVLAAAGCTAVVLLSGRLVSAKLLRARVRRT